MMTQLVRGGAWILLLLLGSVAPCRLAWADEHEVLKKGVVRVLAQVDGKFREGTGFIVKSQGDIVFIVTAAHVIEGDPSPRVEFYKGRSRTMPGHIVGIEWGDEQGLAVLAVQGEIPAHGVLPLNPDKQIKDGDGVTIAGFPRKLAVPWAVTEAKIVARKGKLIVLSGAVEEGNSGGPVVKDGEVIGVIVSRAESYSYVVPSLIAKYALESWNVRFGVTLRSIHETLSPEGVGRMVRERRFNHPPDLSEDGLVGSLFGGFEHEFERQIFGGHPVVIDRATGLMWQQQGSKTTLPYKEAERYAEDLNRSQYGGFSDWRVPTLEEAASLISPTGINDGLFIDREFDSVQEDLWTSDRVTNNQVFMFMGHWYVNLELGGIVADRHAAWIPPRQLGILGDTNRGQHDHSVRAVRSRIEPSMRSVLDTEELPGKAGEPAGAAPSH